jgi:hypothetical protein
MIALSMIFPIAESTPLFSFWSPKNRDDETISDYFLRLKDELFWPRILVRSAPPPDEF